MGGLNVDPEPHLVFAGLEVRRLRDGKTLVLALRGELDLASAPVLERALAEPLSNGDGHILVDLSQLDFMDSSGLAALARARQAAESQQKAFSLRRGAGQVQRLFELTGLDRRFAFDD